MPSGHISTTVEIFLRLFNAFSTSIQRRKCPLGEVVFLIQNITNVTQQNQDIREKRVECELVFKIFLNLTYLLFCFIVKSRSIRISIWDFIKATESCVRFIYKPNLCYLCFPKKCLLSWSLRLFLKYTKYKRTDELCKRSHYFGVSFCCNWS